jgi:hypothetical protein
MGNKVISRIGNRALRTAHFLGLFWCFPGDCIATAKHKTNFANAAEADPAAYEAGSEKRIRMSRQYRDTVCLRRVRAFLAELPPLCAANARRDACVSLAGFR